MVENEKIKLLAKVGELSYDKVEVIWNESQKELLRLLVEGRELHNTFDKEEIINVIKYECKKLNISSK